MASPSIFLSAGDPSGDNAASRLVEVLKRKKPDWSYFGLGGPKLRAAGQTQLADPERLAILGFWEVAKEYRFFKDLLARCDAEIEQRRPKAIILVDYPGFNLRLARRLKRLCIPVIYYISPQVWAWGSNRVSHMRNSVNLILSILPFEEEFFNTHGIRSDFVGHYLLEDIADEYISSIPPQDGHLAILPGSRSQEIERMLEPMLRAAAQYCSKCGRRAVVAGIRGKYDYESSIAKFGSGYVSVSYDDSRSVIARSRVVLTKSGTATLETAIIGRPMVVMYKTGFLTYYIARSLVTLDNIALANLVLGDTVVPELIQRAATPKRIVSELLRYETDPAHFAKTKQKLSGVVQRLGGTGASERAASRILTFLEG